MIEDWTEHNLQEKIVESDLLVLYFYAPICGTCNVSERMLTVAKELVPELTYAKADLNYHGDLAEKYKLMSVPALLLISQGKLVKTIFAFRSVQYLSQELKQLSQQEEA